MSRPGAGTGRTGRGRGSTRRPVAPTVLAIAVLALMACAPGGRAVDAGGDPDAVTAPVDAPRIDARVPDAGRCNGFCDGVADCGGCEDDCLFILCDETCGDGVCTDAECDFCPEDCFDECFSGVICGDGWCDDGECGSCAADCPGGCPDVCGDGTCGDTESCTSCSRDCVCVCGDGLCDASECSGSCPTDCPLGCPACTHDLCTPGVALAPTCDVCAAAICADSPWCCSGEWDASCIEAMATTCGKICPATCGDGRCTEGLEDCASCDRDCGTCPICGDGWCDGAPAEDCASCATDCGRCPTTCGDGACEPGESCVLCAADCGACACGNGVCEFPSETCSSCTPDCGACVCGDGVCAPGEWVGTCPADCTGSCDHDVCAAGSALATSCEPCAALVCLGVPECCTSSWDAWCVSDAATVCGKPCTVL